MFHQLVPLYCYLAFSLSVQTGLFSYILVELQKCLTLTMGLVVETYTSKEKHFLYLHWKWNDREDTRSILTVLLLHFISDTRVEQVANEVYHALKGWRPGVLRVGCRSWLFQSLSPPWCLCGSIWVVIQIWSSWCCDPHTCLAYVANLSPASTQSVLVVVA